MTSPRRDPHPAQQRRWEHIPDTFGSVEDISDALVAREQHQFLLTDAAGNVPAGNKRGLGLYSHDTRHLSTYELCLDGAAPIVLLSTADSGFSIEQVLGNYRCDQEGHVVGRCTVELARRRVVANGVEERLRITNYNPFPVSLRPSYHFAADFADIFEVRGHKRAHAGAHQPPEVTDRTLCYRYLGIDGFWRRTLVVFDQPPLQIDATGAAFDLTLPPRGSAELCLHVLVDDLADEAPGAAMARLHDDYARWRDAFAHVHTDNEVFNQVLGRSLSDLRTLWTHDPHGQAYLAAGTPWFAALFGRDAIISSLQTLPFRADIARETLALFARHQGQDFDLVRGEEPGKILHEVRNDELSVAGELPFQRYYGSVDATPLFLLLAAEYFRWTADTDLLQALMPAIDAGLRWLRDWGDLDRDGFVEHRTDASHGLRNQGWKDSVEGVMHADGSLLDGPVALAEVQGYAYAAYLRLAPLFEAAGEPERAAELRHLALQLRRRFNLAFWLRRLQRIPMALDGAKQPSAVMSSNAGQVLWSGIVSRDRARLVRDALFHNEMFSGWGIRTLASDSLNYYPLGYHVGTVWPHDNAIIALGLKRYGFVAEVNEIATALFDAAREFPSYRLPELFGGQPRSEFQPPVPYPVACRPQAWTAGAMLALLQAILGLDADAPNHTLRVVRPRLPHWLHEVHLTNLRVGEAHVDLHFTTRRGRTHLEAEPHGNVRVEQATGWRRFLDP